MNILKNVLKSILNKTYKLLKISENFSMLKEIKDGIIFNEAIRYLPGIEGPFFPKAGSASYSLLCSLLRILIEAKPKKICELGSGQTTNLFLQYIKLIPDRTLITIENDKDWYTYFSKQFPTAKNFRYICSPLKDCKVSGIKTKWYNYNLSQENNVNMLLIDGPMGTKYYSRIGILNYIPEILGKNFIIILDDCGRKGEKQLLKLMIEKLSKNNIKFKTKTISSFVSHSLIVSDSYKRLLYLI